MSVNLNRNTLKSTLSQVTKGVNFVDFEAEVLVIGGGGRGGLYLDGTVVQEPVTQTANGGGGGAFLSASFLVPATSSLRIDVGQGGSGSLSGNVYTIFRAEDSKISYYNPNTETYEDRFIARGGGAGKSTFVNSGTIVYEENPIDGFRVYDGGSGGGTNVVSTPNNPIVPIGKPMPVVIPAGEVLGYLFTGSVGGGGNNGSTTPTWAGGGGALNSGSAAPSTNQYISSFPTAGQGVEILQTFLSGSIVNQELTKGGQPRLSSEGQPQYIAPANTGQGGGIEGGSGLVAIKYSGEQKIFTNPGQVFTIEDYTIHLFTSSVDITTTGKTFSGSDVDKPTPLIQADVLVAGGGGGRGVSGGGGGAGALVTSSFTLGRNVTYEIVVGDRGIENVNGSQSYLYGFEDTSSAAYSSGSTPYTMSAEGGFCGESRSLGQLGDGGDSGQGYIYKNDIIVQTFPSYSGGSGFGGGGASVTEDGQPGTETQGGLGGDFIGGTILYPWYRNVPEGLRGDSFVGGGGNGIGRGNSNIYDEPAFGGAYDSGVDGATAGAVVIQYPQYYDVEDIVVTGNVTSSIYNGYRTHLFGVGTSSFTLNFNPTSSI